MKKACPIFFILFLGLLFIPDTTLLAQTAPGAGGAAPMNVQIDLGGGVADRDFGIAIQLVILMTLLTFLPAMIMMMTCFARIVIVLGFVRSALGVQQTPSNQIIIGLALFLTFFIMSPTLNRIYSEAYLPYENKQITSQEALSGSGEILKSFMILQTRDSDLEFFLGLANMGPTSRNDLPLRVVLPSFVLSELRTAFEMGFLIFIPFIVVDFLVASTLMAMGMMMMPPVIISLPLKLLLFVLVDGWYLVVSSLVNSFYV